MRACFGSRLGSRLPLITATGWGEIAQSDGDDDYEIEITAGYGAITINRLVIDDRDGGNVSVTMGSGELSATSKHHEGCHTVMMPEGTVISPDGTLTVRVSR